MAIDYGDKTYWEERYAKWRDTAQTGTYEWYSGAEQLIIAALAKYCPSASATAGGDSRRRRRSSSSADGGSRSGALVRGSAILEVGCGNSALADLVAAAGFGRVLAVDYCEEVVKARSAQPHHPDVSFAVMDVCCMASQQPSGSLDVVLDKATADAVDCGGRTSDMMAEIHRVLRPAGLFMLVSCRDPPQRLPDVQAAFELLELAPLPAADGGPCPNAYLYCLRRRP